MESVDDSYALRQDMFKGKSCDEDAGVEETEEDSIASMRRFILLSIQLAVAIFNANDYSLGTYAIRNSR